ncbi:rubredoxin [Phormidium willei BDU 130791]|jgi:rubredoxin|nr:rubredoxin [Phormidium willei BDU 130791]
MDTQESNELQPEQEPQREQTEQQASPPERDRYECLACGYVYEPQLGDDNGNVPAGTPFAEVPDRWRCPVCGARKQSFANVGPKGTASGFKENFSYGLGVNTLTPTQKTLLIFGGLGLGVLFMLSLYGLG